MTPRSRPAPPARATPSVAAALLAGLLAPAVAAQEPLFTFAQVSDSQPQTSAENQRFVDVLRLVAEAGQPGALLPHPVDLVLFAGDITWGNTRSEWVAATDKLDTWLTANDIPFLAVPGNHDVDNSNTSLYEEFIADSGVWDVGSAAITGHNGRTRSTGWSGLRFIGVNNSNPGWNTISSADVADVSARVSDANAALENVFILCHHPHDEKARLPLGGVLPNPSAVGYLHGHLDGPSIRHGLAGISNPNLWDVNTNAIYRDRCLVYFEVFPSELRAHLVVLDQNPVTLPPAVTIPLVHSLVSTTEDDLGIAGALHAGARPDPTARGPEHKLWFAAGSWWGVLWSDASAAWRLQRLDESTQTWVNTGPSVSTDASRSFDALALGSELLLASNVPTTSGALGNGKPGQVARYGYDAGLGRYVADPGTPVAVNDWRARTLALERDASGVLWVAWTQAGEVRVARSLGSAASWSAPVTLASGLASTDTVALVPFGGQLGALWTNASTGAVHFARHLDGASEATWNFELASAVGAVAGSSLALCAADGVVMAAVGAPNAALRLFVRAGPDTWSARELGTAVDGLRDPLLVVDRAHDVLRLVATGPTSAGLSNGGGGALHLKVAPLATLAFPHGRGTLLLEDGGNPSAGFATSTRAAVDLAGGLTVLASVAQTSRYWHVRDALAALPLGPAAAFQAATRVGPAPLVVDFEDLSTNEPTWWSWDFGDGATSLERDPRHVYAQPGTYAVQLRVANGGGEDVLTRSAYVQVDAPSPVQTFTPVADARVYQGNPGSNAGSDVILRVRTETNASYRSFLRFDPGTLAGTLTSARLRLWCTDGSPSGGSLYEITSNTWGESTITWSNQPSLPASPLLVLGTVDTGAWVEIELGAAAVTGGPISLALAGGSSNSAYYSSREGVNAPQLVLTYAGAGEAPTADFTGTPRTGPAPLVVAFTDASTGAPTQWSWDFGDGGTSTQRNPTHTYQAPGVYTVVLDASNASGLDTRTRLDYVVVEEPPPPSPVSTFVPVADARVNEGSPGQNYGNETTLRLRDSSGSRQHSYLLFDLSSLSGSVQSARLRLYCTDSGASGGSLHAVATGWTESGLTWNNRPSLPAASLGSLGAVSTSTWYEVDVTAAVQGPGPVALAIAGGTSNTVLYSSRQGAHPPELVVTTGTPVPPSAEFSGTPQTGAAPLQVSFTDLSLGATAWSWDFGDGSLSSERHPTHLYVQPGLYTVRLVASNAAGSDTRVRTDFVHVTSPSPVRTLLPGADARVNQANPSSNAGADALLRVRESSGASYHTYLRFDLRGLGPATSARLRLFANDGSKVAGIVHATSNSWTEAGVTWANQPGPIGAAIASTGAVANDAWAEFDVKAALDGPGLVDGVLNLVVVSSSTNSAYYSSREGAHPPELVLTLVSP